MVSSQMFYIVKKDGNRESFSYDKLIASILKAGVPIKDAEIISKKIENWLYSPQHNGQMESLKLRNKIIEVLSVNFPLEADTYQAFKKG